MRFLVSLLLIALLSFALCLYLPWWMIAVAAFAVSALLPQAPGRSFLAGFLAVFLLWAVLAFVISNQNNDILAHKVSMMILKVDQPLLLILATAFIGGLISGLAALAASYLRPAKVVEGA